MFFKVSVLTVTVCSGHSKS